MVVGADDDRDRLRRAVAVINGKILQGVEVRAPSLDTTFVFAGYRLRVFPVTASVDLRGWQQLSLRSPAGRILDIGPGASWRFRRSGTGGADRR